MNFQQTIKISWEGVALNKVRSFLTTLGVIIGVAAVIVMLAVSAGAEAEIADQINSLGANLIMVMPGMTRGGFGPGSRPPSLSYEDLPVIASSIDGIDGVSAEQTTTQDVKGDSVTIEDVSVVGTTSGFTAVRDYQVWEGRFVTDEDNDRPNKVAMLGYDLAVELFGDPASAVGESLASIAGAYGVTVASIVEANRILDANLIEVGQELAIPDPAQVPDATTEVETPVVQPVAVAAPEPALEERADTDPGPPLTIEVSANRATQDPLVAESQQYLVTGVVRNDGDETYAVSAILATFFDAEGFRGTIDRKIRDGKVVSAEWNWHGQTEAEFAALLLAPGEEWPFSVTITGQDMASFLLHPDAVATERESAPVALSGVRVVDNGTGYLQISGTAVNANAFAIKNVTVSGVLLDSSGQIVSLGSTYVIQEGIAPGESVQFDVRVAREAYIRYELYAQAERDW